VVLNDVPLTMRMGRPDKPLTLSSLFSGEKIDFKH